MSGELRSFNFSGIPVRVVFDKDHEPWWFASEICDILEIQNPTSALDRLDEDEKSTLDSTEGGPGRRIINESGLYSLVLGSRKKIARTFKKWVTSEVLPSIRKTGAYQVHGPVHDLLTMNRESMLEMALTLEREKNALKAQTQALQVETTTQQATIAVMEPKAEFFDAVAEAKGGQPLAEIAKILGTGQKRIFNLLREKGVLMRNNLPYQPMVDRGYFKVIEKRFMDPEERPHVTFQTLVTGKGLIWLQKHWDALHENLSLPGAL